MDQPPPTLEGRTVIITGAGRGLGRSYALELARRGAAVVVNDLERDSADEVVSLITEAGGKAEASYHDVGTADGGAALVAQAVDDLGGLDVVVINAGILRNGYFEDLSIDDIDLVLRVNLASAFYVTQPAWRIMKEQRYGRVVITSSGSGMFSHGGGSNYAASKAGLYGLTKALAFEGQDFGVTVNAVLPWAATGIGVRHPVPGHMENWSRRVKADLPEGDERRNPEMVAHLVAYLASQSCEVTGEAFSVCRGRYGRVFVGVADGWFADPATVSAEVVADHMDEIRDITTSTVPMWVFDEVNDVMAHMPDVAPQGPV